MDLFALFPGALFYILVILLEDLGALKNMTYSTYVGLCVGRKIYTKKSCVQALGKNSPFVPGVHINLPRTGFKSPKAKQNKVEIRTDILIRAANCHYKASWSDVENKIKKGTKYNL